VRMPGPRLGSPAILKPRISRCPSLASWPDESQTSRKLRQRSAASSVYRIRRVIVSAEVKGEA